MVKKEGQEKHKEKGVVIIAVLWISALIMWFALQISYDSRLQGEEEIHILRRSQALYLAVGGAYEALARMGYAVTTDDDTKDWQPNGKPNVVEYEIGQAIVVIEEETQKVNINEAPPDQLKKVLEKAGVEEDALDKFTDVIGDFLDPDDLTRLDGAEKDDYEQMEMHYDPFNGPLIAQDQMLLIPGITQKLFYGYGQEAKPFKKGKYKKFRDLPWPGEDSLFQNCTVYGTTTQLFTDESEEEEVSEDQETAKDDAEEEEIEEEEIEEETVAWEPNGIYRILSCGRSYGGSSAVLLWMVVHYIPNKKPGYEILHRKIL
jgi:general secretion pathway protein K